MTVLISPWAQTLKNGQPNPKNYPFWKQLIELIDRPIIQVGVAKELQLVEHMRRDLSLSELQQLIEQCDAWIAVDSFFQHYCWHLGKPGIVLWGQSDPLIFGHHENINLLKDRAYLRSEQFWLWEQATYREDCWVAPSEVIVHLNRLLENKEI